MSLTANRSLEIGERKIFHELRRTSYLESRNQTLLDSRGRNESDSLYLVRNRREENFCMNTTYIMSRKWESNILGLWKAESESNSQ